MATGRIFNIQRYSIHDGPGIRTIVFFKGCVMRCAWCCNPESQQFEIQTLAEGDKVKVMGRDVSVSDIMPEILADLPYYRRSGGGVTLSGGEVLCQADFAAEFAAAASLLDDKTLSFMFKSLAENLKPEQIKEIDPAVISMMLSGRES